MTDQTYAPSWRPTEGETIEGKITDIDTRATQYGAYPILTLACEDGPHAVHAFHAVLQRGIQKIEPQIGDQIAIRFLGSKPLKSDPSKSFNDYQVTSDKPKQPMDWTKFGDKAVPEDVVPTPPPDNLDDDIPF